MYIFVVGKMETSTLSTDLQRLEKMAGMLKAIAHPTRMSLIHLLEAGAELTVTDIYTQLNIPQAVASQHIAVLKERGVLKGRREGKKSYYSLRHQKLIEVMRLIESCQDC